MGAKLPQGNDIYDLLIHLILELSPQQASLLYKEILPRYSKKHRSKTKIYNRLGVEDANGKIRLTEFQWRAIKTSCGMEFVGRAFGTLTDYIEYLEAHVDEPGNKAKLKNYMGRTHNKELTKGGWAYEKCKRWISKETPKINVNPYLIEDFVTAKKYVLSLSPDLWDCADVQYLLLKFPTLKDFQKELPEWDNNIDDV